MKNQVLKHLRSNDVIDGQPKLPSSNDLEYGEIAINYASGNETLSFKNDDGEIFYINLNSLKNIINEIVKNEKVTATSIISIANNCGIINKDGVISFVKKENANYIRNANSLSEAVNILDEQLKRIENLIS